MITFYSIVLTVSVYCFSRFLTKKYPTPLTSPVFLSTVIIIMILGVSKVSYQDYTPAKTIMTYLLGPATVSLAVPIYKNRELFLKNFIAAISGIFIGSVSTITAALIMAKSLHLSKFYLLGFSVKSVTVPVAIEIGGIIHGNISLIAAYVIITGMVGAMFGAKLCKWFKIDHPFAQGLAMGTISHGIGTSEAVKEGEIQGAVSGAAMGIAAVLTSFIIPYIINFII
ncbi:LrgB family protein [Neobacillus cucumis]|uniref:LrgB family protein n=1 Tax=Neobacillus cucumis TaxID=1740721 RepID=UPI00196590FE|nr:LrgB family protein [Neobacillus cucumis]MBM7655079.1 putative effector of murein hydrolase [Neobacillus cucumis]